MLSNNELIALLTDLESDSVERTISVTDTNKFCEAICAFANDFPNHKKSGYLFIGVKDDGTPNGPEVTDKLLLELAAHKTNGNILPIPSLAVYKTNLPEGEIAVVEVFPSDTPPVRFKGRAYIRTGPRKGIATENDERILVERRTSNAKTFDIQPSIGSAIEDLILENFKLTYQPSAIDRETLEENHREIKLQLSSLRFFDLKRDYPTHAGILLFGTNPLYFLPGAYIQFIRFKGNDLASEVMMDKKFSGNLVSILRLLDEFINLQITQKSVFVTAFREEIQYDYPPTALRELLFNAIMHRNYESNAPIQFYWFDDKIEIQNTGGLYGNATPENFPNQNDYRNPTIAEAMKVLGYVNRYNVGIARVEDALIRNQNPPAEFVKNQPSYFSVTIKKRIE